MSQITREETHYKQTKDINEMSKDSHWAPMFGTSLKELLNEQSTDPHSKVVEHHRLSSHQVTSHDWELVKVNKKN